jgi:hypothetical protein
MTLRTSVFGDRVARRVFHRNNRSGPDAPVIGLSPLTRARVDRDRLRTVLVVGVVATATAMTALGTPLLFADGRTGTIERDRWTRRCARCQRQTLQVSAGQVWAAHASPAKPSPLTKIIAGTPLPALRAGAPGPCPISHHRTVRLASPVVRDRRFRFRRVRTLRTEQGGSEG